MIPTGILCSHALKALDVMNITPSVSINKIFLEKSSKVMFDQTNKNYSII
jgi:hypothetical protein